MATLLQDLRAARRALVGAPGLTLAAVLSLGLAIGANTTVFTSIQAVLLRPVPGAAEPRGLWVIAMHNREGQQRSFSYPNFRDVRDRARLSAVFGQEDVTLSLEVDRTAERAWGMLVSGDYFRILGVRPAVGRLLTPADDRVPGGHPVMVLSHAYWQRRFGGDPAIVGRTVAVNRVPYTVVGVTAEGFIGTLFGVAQDAWLPLAMQPQVMGGDRLEARGNGWMQAMARVAPGATVEAANAELAAIMAQLGEEYPDINAGRRMRLVPPSQASFGAPSVLAPMLAILAAVVALVLLIACANVANLLLARAASRRREMAIRVSMGASRWRLVRQLLTEALALSALAALVGLATAGWTSGLLLAFVPPMDAVVSLRLGVDASAFAFALAVSTLTSVAFGLVPALQASRVAAVETLKDDSGRTAGSRAAGRLRGALVVAQVAVCVVLLVAAALFVRSFAAAQRLDLGFDPRGVLIAGLDLVPSGYTPATGRPLQHRLVEAVRAVPGVTAAGLARRVPLGFGGSGQVRVSIAGYAPPEGTELTIGYNQVGPGYFATVRMPLRRGREFDAGDHAEAPAAVIVNETMARRYWGTTEVLGRMVTIGTREHAVVGVVADGKYRQIGEAPSPYMYLALDQAYAGDVVLHARAASGDPAALLPAVREAVRGVDPALPLFETRAMEAHLQTAVFAQRIGATLLGVMGLLALALAAVGLYGVMAYSVRQRQREIGIRLAVGAAPAAVRRLVLCQGLALVAAGLAIGVGLGLVATGFLRAVLPGISPRDPLSFVAVALALGAVAVIALWGPARTASRLDPAVTLRAD